jgi:RsiW-degrading membrane proteinase PrsW (M82 family)
VSPGRALGLALLGVGPPLLWCCLFYYWDRLEPEPHGHVLGAFGLGALAVAPALLVAQLLERALPALAQSPVGDALVLSGLVEESTKLAVFLLSAYTWVEFDEPYDGILYMVALSLGFAATENTLYVLRGGAAKDI